jgi:hypothetical protein
MGKRLINTTTPQRAGETGGAKIMKHKYTVQSGDGQHDCNHNHRTCQAAQRCKSKLTSDARYYGARILRDGERANGIGLWADGEPNY